MTNAGSMDKQTRDVLNITLNAMAGAGTITTIQHPLNGLMQVISKKASDAKIGNAKPLPSPSVGRFAFVTKLVLSAPNAYKAGATRSLVNKGTREVNPKEEDVLILQQHTFINSLRNTALCAGFETLQNPFNNAVLLSTAHDLGHQKSISVRKNLVALWRIGSGFNYTSTVIGLLFSTQFTPYCRNKIPQSPDYVTQKNLAAGSVAGAICGLLTLPLQMLHRETINQSSIDVHTGKVSAAKQSIVLKTLYQSYKKSDKRAFAQAGLKQYGSLAKVQVPRSIITFALVQAAFGTGGWFTVDMLAKLGFEEQSSPSAKTMHNRPSV